MKISRLLVFLLPLLLAACGLSDQQKADYDSVQRSGVSSAIYDKMMHGDDLSLYDIKSLARARVSDAVILRYLRDHQTIYTLDSADVQDLRSAGVSQSIVDYMLQTPRMYGPNPVIGVGIGYGPGWYDPYGPYGPYYGPYYGPPPYYGPYHHWH
jgi:hypothetical protein